eukprot:TRINITY_DN41537_c0_g1_i2.p1 TRINITY_DN41537_c0_g1~~TRINITY_DN41537_c0_g1_i2.p1  ORF type:complete len:366 (+),score=55.23 TRINITY_DN41537_c0_g1_i2:64-1161(+)
MAVARRRSIGLSEGRGSAGAIVNYAPGVPRQSAELDKDLLRGEARAASRGADCQVPLLKIDQQWSSELQQLVLEYLQLADISVPLFQQVASELRSKGQKKPLEDGRLCQVFRYVTEGSFRLCITTLHGALCTVDAHMMTSVAEVKEAIEHKTGHPWVRQHLMVNGLPMVNPRPLVSYGITPFNCTLHFSQSTHKLYAVGGMDQDSLLTTGEFCDPLGARCTHDHWELMPHQMPCHRRQHAAAGVNGKLYVIGGIDQYHQPTANVFLFDPGKGTWLENAPMQTSRRSHAAVATTVGGRGRVYALGGVGGNPPRDLDSFEVLETDIGEWETLPPMSMTRRGLAAAMVLSRDVEDRKIHRRAPSPSMV